MVRLVTVVASTPLRCVRRATAIRQLHDVELGNHYCFEGLHAWQLATGSYRCKLPRERRVLGDRDVRVGLLEAVLELGLVHGSSVQYCSGA